MNSIELFSGSGTFSKVFAAAGWRTFTIDIRRRKGVCEPDLRKNVLDISSQDLPYREVHALWASPPCDIWSYAAGSHHWKSATWIPKTEKCAYHLHILEKCLAVIQELQPRFFFVENPRGRLRNYPRMLHFLKQSGAVCKELTLSSYGFPTTKPTNIFTNALDWKPKELDSFGRGAKVPGTFSNLTKCQRQKTPRALAEEILNYCSEVLYAD